MICSIILCSYSSTFSSFIGRLHLCTTSIIVAVVVGFITTTERRSGRSPSLYTQLLWLRVVWSVHICVMRVDKLTRSTHTHNIHILEMYRCCCASNALFYMMKYCVAGDGARPSIFILFYMHQTRNELPTKLPNELARRKAPFF